MQVPSHWLTDDDGTDQIKSFVAKLISELSDNSDFKFVALGALALVGNLIADHADNRADAHVGADAAFAGIKILIDERFK